MKQKTPQEKKALSYSKDRRNAYGESRANSRFSIRKNKTFPKRAYRHRIAQILNSDIDNLDAEYSEFIDSEVKSVKRRNWKKCPDISLKDWVQGRFAYRKRMFRAKSERQFKIQRHEIFSNLKFKTTREDDGQWIGEVTNLAGVLVYAETQGEADQKVRALAWSVITERLKNGEF